MGQTCSAPGPVLLRAAKQGELDTVRRCLKEDPGLAHHLDAHGRSALYFAARAGEVEALQLLTTAAAKGRPPRTSTVAQPHRATGPVSEARLQSLLGDYLNVVNEGGESALAAACRRGHAQAVTFLLAQGADPCHRAVHSKATCLHLAVISGSMDCVEALLKHKAPGEVLHRGEVRSASNLMDLHDSHGYTPLLYACKYGYMEIVKALIREKASLYLAVKAREPRSTTQSYTGCSALHLAAIFGHTEILRVLLEAVMSNLGCEVGTDSGPFRLLWEGTPQDPRLCRNARNETPFKCAAKHRNMHAATLLDPTIPLTWVVQTEPPKNNVPALATIAKSALHDHHVQWLEQYIAELEFEASRSKTSSQIPCVDEKTASKAIGNNKDNIRDKLMGLEFEQYQQSNNHGANNLATSNNSWTLGCVRLNSEPASVPDSMHGGSIVSSSAGEANSESSEECSSSSNEFNPSTPHDEIDISELPSRNGIKSKENVNARHFMASESDVPVGRIGRWNSNLYTHLYDCDDRHDDDEALCGVCLDRMEQVILKPCDHSLCAECAMAIVKHPCQGFTCPYCRLMFGALGRVEERPL